ncbi:MAG: GNAT family N-acetyltransferase [Mycobacterium leprae]
MDWESRAVESEIAFSQALGGQPVEYPDFIHMCNPYVPWNGDFNRAVGVKLTDLGSFDELVSEVERIHRAKGLDRPNRYDLYPPGLDPGLWQGPLRAQGYHLETAIFFSAPALAESLPEEFTLTIPAEEEYLAWFRALVQARGYYTAEWFEQVRPLQLGFTKLFRPYWLFRSGELVAWVYCAHLGEYTRLFEVEVDESCRGQGLGTLLLHAVRAESGRLGAGAVLLQTGEELRGFYERAGFRECSRSSIIWRMSAG